MPRSFLITNKRYSSSIAKLRRFSTTTDSDSEDKLLGKNSNPCNSLKLSALNQQDVSFRSLSSDLLIGFLRKPFDKVKSDFSDNKSENSENSLDESVNLRVDSQYSLDLLRQPNNDKQCESCDVETQLNSDDSSDSSKYENVKVILNFTPPSTPFQSPTNDIHICPDCGKRYSTSSNLTRHRQTHRSVTDKKARKCPHCEKVYVSMPAYSMHVRTHTQGCRCHFCGKSFSRPWLLQGHIRTHTGEKPFKCHICSKAFADKSNLRAHIQTHSQTKPYICQRCNKGFALKSYLYKHEESSCMRMHRGLMRFEDGDEYQKQVSSGSESMNDISFLGELVSEKFQNQELSINTAKKDNSVS